MKYILLVTLLLLVILALSAGPSLVTMGKAPAATVIAQPIIYKPDICRMCQRKYADHR